MRDKLTFEFGTIAIYDNYVIAEMFEGVVVKTIYNQVLIDISNTYFFETPFGYITHRVNSYSVNPGIYSKTNKIPNLVAFAIVSDNDERIDTSKFEKLFITKPIKKFTSLQKAITWIESLV